MKIAVATPTGHVGSAVVDFLLEFGGDIRVVLLGRRPDRLKEFVRRGAEMAIGSQDDADYLVKATRGVEALFWATPPGYGSDDVRAFQNRLGRAARHGHPHQQDSAGGQPVVHRGPLGFGRRADQRPARRGRAVERSGHPHYAPAARFLLRELALATRFDPEVRDASRCRFPAIAATRCWPPAISVAWRPPGWQAAVGSDTLSASCTARPT